MESLTLQVEWPLTRRAYIQGKGEALWLEYFFFLPVDGPITRRAYKQQGEAGEI